MLANKAISRAIETHGIKCVYEVIDASMSESEAKIAREYIDVLDSIGRGPQNEVGIRVGCSRARVSQIARKLRDILGV